MFIRRYGSADSVDSEARTPLVLIHGAGGNLAQWPPGVRRLPGAYVIAVDLPGHGNSRGPGHATIEAYAHAVLAMLHAERLPPALLVGHSMGGAIVLDIARRAPDAVAGLGLVATGARLPVGPALLDAIEHDFAQAVTQITAWVFGPTVESAQRTAYARYLARLAPALLLDDFRACAAFDARKDLAALTMPALVIGGRVDRMTPPKFSEYLAAQLPHAELRLLAETGHMIMLEQPAALAQFLSEFLDKLNQGIAPTHD